MEQADCPYRVVGLAQQDCGPFFDDMETNRGWIFNPDHADTATAGAWARGEPSADSHQPAGAPSGEAILGTGLHANHDVDGGTTTVRSHVMALPSGATTLRFRYRAALSANAAASDGLMVQLIAPNGQVRWRALAVHGTGTARSLGWHAATLPIPASLRGTSVAIEFTATDDGADSTVEAGIDDVRITAP